MKYSVLKIDAISKRFMMQHALFLSLLYLLFTSDLKAQKLQGGEKIFKYNCVSCHTIGKGVLEGPDLKNSTSRHSQKWLYSFIRSSQKMAQSGDKKAIALMRQFPGKTMPDFTFSDEQLKQLLEYIQLASRNHN